MCKIILTENPLEIHWGAAMHPSSNCFKWALFSNYTATDTYTLNGRISGVLPPSVAKLKWTIPIPSTNT